jgi:hypothetical protein
VGEGPTATLLRQLIEVDLLARPTCHGPMRVVAFITRASVVDQFLTHLRTRAAREVHAGLPSPHRRGPARARARHAPHALPPTPRLPHEAAPPDTPRPRGAVRRVRLSHRCVSRVPAGFGHPP